LTHLPTTGLVRGSGTNVLRGVLFRAGVPVQLFNCPTVQLYPGEYCTAEKNCLWFVGSHSLLSACCVLSSSSSTFSQGCHSRLMAGDRQVVANQVDTCPAHATQGCHLGTRLNGFQAGSVTRLSSYHSYHGCHDCHDWHNWHNYHDRHATTHFTAPSTAR
jgi:hypothetical protein